MTTKTRYFVIVSLLVLAVGFGVGLTAYYMGFSTSAFSGRGGPDELQYVPRNAAVLAYANVQDVMASNLRRRLKEAMPISEDGQQDFRNHTGINIETDIDRVVACLLQSPGADGPSSGMVIATGRFDTVKIEALMREHGARVEDYKGKRVLVGTERELRTRPGADAAPAEPLAGDRPTQSFSLAFLEPGIVAVGGADLVHRAIDLANGGDNITTNDEVMELVRSLESGNTAWALGHFDALQSKAKLPDNVASRIPAITLFSVGARLNGGLDGTLRAETRDDESANNLRDVLRGFVALGKLQAGGKPEMQAMMQSLELGGSGKSVALSFSVPAELLDMLGQHLPNRTPRHQN